VSRIDKIKEEIGWLKIVFGILVATDISLIAWLAENYTEANRSLVAVCSISVLLITLGVVQVNRIAYRKIDELEGM